MNTELYNEISEKVEIIKKEVDALQITIMEGKKSWYKNIPIIVSMIALMFSFGTTYVSNNRINEQHTQNLKSELRGLLIKIATLPIENFELYKKYPDDFQGQAFLGSTISQKNAILVYQAVEIVDKLTENEVTAIDYNSVAYALQQNFDNESALKYSKLASEISKDFNSEIASLRTYANLLFLTGEHEKGRETYNRALEIFNKYDEYNEFTQKQTHILTHIHWVTPEANIGHFENVKLHLKLAEDIIASMSPGPGTDQLRQQIEQLKNNFANFLNP